jgi:hypothetical protein
MQRESVLAMPAPEGAADENVSPISDFHFGAPTRFSPVFMGALGAVALNRSKTKSDFGLVLRLAEGNPG